jgi:hypothetical protein
MFKGAQVFEFRLSETAQPSCKGCMLGIYCKGSDQPPKEATIYQAKSVLKNASKEDLQAIREGKTSIKKVYNNLIKRKGRKAPLLKEAHNG